MNAQEKYNWKKTRQKGKSRFVLNGVILYGLVPVFATYLLQFYFEYFFSDESNYSYKSENFIYEVLLRIFVFTITSFFVNYYLWNKNEEEFSRHLKT